MSELSAESVRLSVGDWGYIEHRLKLIIAGDDPAHNARMALAVLYQAEHIDGDVCA